MRIGVNWNGALHKWLVEGKRGWGNNLSDWRLEDVMAWLEALCLILLNSSLLITCHVCTCRSFRCYIWIQFFTTCSSSAAHVCLYVSFCAVVSVIKEWKRLRCRMTMKPTHAFLCVCGRVHPCHIHVWMCSIACERVLSPATCVSVFNVCDSRSEAVKHQ